jgi:hypothetical protein
MKPVKLPLAKKKSLRDEDEERRKKTKTDVAPNCSMVPKRYELAQYELAQYGSNP